MDKQKPNPAATELGAVDTILQRGVKIHIVAPWFIRWFKKTVTLRVGSPFEGTLLRVSRYYLSTGLESHKLESLTVENALVLMSIHGKAISRAVACAMLNGYISGKLFTRPLAWYLRWHMTPQQLLGMTRTLLIYGGTADFMNTTRLVRNMKATTPNLGHKTEER